MGRTFEAKPATLGEVPMLIGIVGPPGGGKTYSSLRLARGMQQVRPGPIALIDTERGRASKYAPEFAFLTAPFDPPFRPTDFLDAVRQQIAKHDPAAIIVDTLSDEHEGEGGVIDWHDAEVPRMGGNEHAAWSKPKADRKRMIAGFLQITTPLIFTFRAREKTVQQRAPNGKKEVVNVGWSPIAPLEIVHALDLTCLLPPRADGIPVWRSDRVGEDFIIKLPRFLQPFITQGRPLDEETGRAIAAWAKGETPSPAPAGRSKLEEAAIAKAGEGSFALDEWIARLNERQRAAVQAMRAELDPIAQAADLADEQEPDPPADIARMESR